MGFFLAVVLYAAWHQSAFWTVVFGLLAYVSGEG